LLRGAEDLAGCKVKKAAIIILLVLAFTLTACSSETVTPATGLIYLFGEQHGEELIMQKQFELWHDFYHGKDMRHLFVELPYYTAEFLNIWMQSDDDEIFDELFNELWGTSIHVPFTKTFYQTIKAECPETIFHGTDVGHQHDTTGARFLQYLEDNNLQETEQYILTQEAIEQGRHFHSTYDLEYRVDMKTNNFIREFDNLVNQDIMGIYGAHHTQFGTMISESFPTLAERLRERYGEAVHSESLLWLLQ
jgi:hypothetical protein